MKIMDKTERSKWHWLLDPLVTLTNLMDTKADTDIDRVRTDIRKVASVLLLTYVKENKLEASWIIRRHDNFRVFKVDGVSYQYADKFNLLSGNGRRAILDDVYSIPYIDALMRFNEMERKMGGDES